MDVTPFVPGHKQFIQTYGDGQFKVSGQLHRGAVIVFPEETVQWPVDATSGITAESLAAVIATGRDVEVLLVGCGERMVLIPRAVREALKASGVVIEPMATGPACRTYNVLMAEERRVAAALLPV